MTSTPEERPAAPQPPAWRRYLRRLFGAIPTRFLLLGFVAIALGISALFGGLKDVPVAALPVVAPSETVTGAQLDITIERSVLIDGFPEQGIVPTEGKRLLVVIATVEDTTTLPVTSAAGIGIADNLRPIDVDGITEASTPLTVAILSDGTESPELQPGVPEELGFMWEVEPGALSDGQDLRVGVYDKVYTLSGDFTAGDYYDDPFVSAYVETTVEDVGAGVEP